MPSIAGYELLALDGVIYAGQRAYQLHPHAGYALPAVTFTAQQTPVSTLVSTEMHDDETQAEAAWQAYRALQGQLVTVVDDWDRRWTGCRILGASPAMRSPMGAPLYKAPCLHDARTRWVVELTWRVLYQVPAEDLL